MSKGYDEVITVPTDISCKCAKLAPMPELQQEHSEQSIAVVCSCCGRVLGYIGGSNES